GRHRRRQRGRRTAHLGRQLRRQAGALPLPSAPLNRQRGRLVSWTLRLKIAPALRLDLRAIVPTALAAHSSAEAAQLPVAHGNDTLALAEIFAIERIDDGEDTLVFDGDCARCDRIGWQLGGGRIEVRGNVGDYVGAGMAAGEIRVLGKAGVLAGCEMQGGVLDVAGNVGDFAAGALPGSMDGMRGGTLIVRASA